MGMWVVGTCVLLRVLLYIYNYMLQARAFVPRHCVPMYNVIGTQYTQYADSAVSVEAAQAVSYAQRAAKNPFMLCFVCTAEHCFSVACFELFVPNFRRTTTSHDDADEYEKYTQSIHVHGANKPFKSEHCPCVRS